MPLLFDAFNIFSRKSRLASCAVSLASVSAAPVPKTLSSSPSTSGPSTLEVTATPEEPEVCTIHVEVGAGSECRESVGEPKGAPELQGTTRKLPRSPRRPAARHALLKCTMSPPSSKDPTRTLRRSTVSVSQASSSSSSGHRRKRASSTSSIAEASVVIAFPTSGEGETDSGCKGNSEGGEGWIMGGAGEDTRPPRKRARRSAVSTSNPSSSSSPSSRCKQERSLSSSLGLNDLCSPPSEPSPPSSSPQSPSSPRLRTRSPSPPVNPRTNFTRQQRDLASVYHTLIMHHEVTIPGALDEQRTLRDLQVVQGSSALGLEMNSYSGKFDEAVQQELQELDGVLLTRIYLRLLLSRVPVAPLQHDRLRRTGDWDGVGVESDLVLDSPPDLDSERVTDRAPGKDREMDESPWISLEDSMDVDGAQVLSPPSSSSASSPDDSPPPTPEVPQWVGPPYPSLSALVVDLILRYRHRAALESRRKRNRPRVSKSGTKSRLGLASYTLSDLVKEGRRRSFDEGRRMDEALDGMPVGMMDAERMDVDKLPESATRSTFGWSEPDEEEAGFGRDDVRPLSADTPNSSEPSSLPGSNDGDGDFDSDSDDDMEWKRLRIELVAGSSSEPIATPTPSQPIPIRPPSPVPHQLDSDDLSPPAILHAETTPLGVRRRPIKDVTNTPPSARSQKPSSSRSGRIQKSPPGLRKPLPKIRYPEHALAGSK